MDSANSSRERDQCRISVDEKGDWDQVKQNFTEAIVGVLDTKLGPSGSATERDLFMQHLMQWRDDTFELARYNVRVNGIDMEEIEDDDETLELEPYDELLDRQLWTHFATRLRWDKTLAARRRQDPLNAQALMEDLIMREHEAEMEEIPPMIDIDAPNEEIGGVNVERIDSISSLHEQSMALIQGWKDATPRLLEKADRIEQVVNTDSKLTP